VGSGQDETLAGLGCTGVIQWPTMDATQAAPHIRESQQQNHSARADSMCYSLFSKFSKIYLNFSMKKTELAKF